MLTNTKSMVTYYTPTEGSNKAHKMIKRAIRTERSYGEVEGLNGGKCHYTTLFNENKAYAVIIFSDELFTKNPNQAI